MGYASACVAEYSGMAWNGPDEIRRKDGGVIKPLTITAVCCTFARTDHLVEALACFLKQDYPNKKLVIFNSCVEQQLLFEHPDVIVHNATERPKTMGETRNQAIELAPEGLLVVWDDDDLYASNHLSNFARGFDPQLHGWSKLDKQFYMESLQLKGVSHGTANVVAFTKKAWRETGGYNEINVGEDQQFIGRLSSKFQGNLVTLAHNEISFFYRWGTGCYHLSGQGQDRPNQLTSMERSQQWATDQMNALREPRGEVKLVPKLHHNYEGLAKTFVQAVTNLHAGRRGKVALVCLGHAGDLLNNLPVAKYIADRHQKPMFFTSRQYGSVLDGVSYVEPVYLDLPDSQILKAIELAKTRAEIVLTLQVHGDNYQFDRLCSSYNEDAWRMAGLLEHFHNLKQFPLVIDRRDLNREARLAETLPLAGQPVMLVNVTGGLSSPWPDGGRFLDWVRKTFQTQFNVIDLSQVRAERIYDVLGLLDRAAILITSDTYTVHLATASTVPVIAILNDNSQPFGKAWLKSKPRYEPLLTLNYSDALTNLKAIHCMVQDGAGKRRVV